MRLPLSGETGERRTVCLVSLPGGDADNSNTVDVDNTTAVLNAYNSTTTAQTAGADGDGSGSIDVDDLTLVLNHYNTTGASEPTAAPWHLADLALSTSGAAGTQTVTGTVRLAQTSPTPVFVTLRSSGNYYATFSSNAAQNVTTSTVTIPAGSLSATFSLFVKDLWTDDDQNDHPLTEPLSVTISASASGWTQAASLTVLPATTSFTVQNLSAIPANGAVVLDWRELPEGSVKGYNVYRLVGGTPTKLNAVPLPSAIYVDNGRTNGTASSYQVTVVKLDNTETPRTATGASASTTPNTAYNSLTWVTLPTGTLSGSAGFQFSSKGSIKIGYVLIDNKICGVVHLAGSLLFTVSPYMAIIDTNALYNGVHTLQIVAGIGNGASLSSAITFTCYNAISQLKSTSTVGTSGHSTVATTAQLDNDSKWSFTINNASNNRLSQWSGTGSEARISLTDHDVESTLLTGEALTLTLSTSSAAGQMTIARDFQFIPPQPVLIALFDYTVPASNLDRTLTLALSRRVQDAISRNSLNGVSLSPDIHINATVLARWLKTSARGFSLYSHGSFLPEFGGVAHLATWGDLVFADTWSSQEIFQVSKHPSWVLVIDELVKTTRYTFLYLDFCHSAGGASGADFGNPPPDSAPDRVDLSWAAAFRFDFANGAFFAFNGSAGANVFSRFVNPRANDYSASVWYTWRNLVWNYLGLGYSLSDATFQATLHTPTPSQNEPIYPWDINRPYFTGDVLVGFPH